MSTRRWEMEETAQVECGRALRGGQTVLAELGHGNGIFTKYEDCDLAEAVISI